MKRIALLAFIVTGVLPCLAQAYIYRVGAYPTVASSWVVVESTYAYVIDSTNLLILAIADPADPTLIGSLPIPGQPKRMDVKNGFAYIAAGDSGLQIANLTTPSNPQIAGHFYTGASAKDIVADSIYAYLMDFYGLRILDISNPANPTELGRMDHLGYGEGIAKKDSIVYHIRWDIESDIIWAINVSDPSNPFQTDGFIEGGMFARGLHVYNDDLYVIWSYGIEIWDISNPNIFAWPPILLSLSGVTWVSADGNLAFASHGQTGVSSINRANRDTAFVIESYDTPGIARHLVPFKDYINHQYICVADNDSLQILRVVGVGIDDNITAPNESSILSNYPNPFNSSTTITLSNQAEADLSIFDIGGRLQATLHITSGKTVWNASGLSSGIYFARTTISGQRKIIKLIYLK